MPKIFDDILRDSESLFLNELALTYDFIPKSIEYRENENQYIATCIKPLFQKRSGRNLFIFGPPGIGKTLAVKSVFREIEENYDDVLPIYINCWKTDTGFKILCEICELLDYKWTHNKRTDELLKIVAGMLNKKNIVFCFDECDKLKDVDFLYSLLEEIYRKTILLITNERSWIINLDNRIRSRLNADSLEFRPYKKEEVKGILKTRVEYGFAPNVLSDDAFNLIADETFKANDIRTGLFLLKDSGDIAESKSSRKISLEHTKESVSKLNNFKIKSSKDLEKEEKSILEMIKNNSGKSVKELYELYQKGGWDKSYRTFHRKIQDLKKNRMIDVEEVARDGITSVVRYTKKLDEF